MARLRALSLTLTDENEVRHASFLSCLPCKLFKPLAFAQSQPAECQYLAKLQCEQGALHSYREAAANLERLNAQRRSINNHDRIKHLTNQVGERLSQENQKTPSQDELPEPAQELIVQVDGGHIPTKEKDKRSFETRPGKSGLEGEFIQEDLFRFHGLLLEIRCDPLP